MRYDRRKERQSINCSAFYNAQILNETDGIMEQKNKFSIVSILTLFFLNSFS